MKKILILLAAVCVCLTTNAQNFEISAGGGMSYNKMSTSTKSGFYPRYNAEFCFIGLPNISLGLNYSRSQFDKAFFNAYGLVADANFGGKTKLGVGLSLGLYDYATFVETVGIGTGRTISYNNTAYYGLRMYLKRLIGKHFAVSLNVSPTYSSGKGFTYFANEKTDIYSIPVIANFSFRF